MSESPSPPREFSLPRLLGLLTLVGVTAAIAYWVGVNSVEQPTDADNLKIYGMDSPTRNQLHAEFVDADGDLVADPPQDEAQWIDPPTLNFCYLASDQQRYEKAWAGFLDVLAAETGKEVNYLPMNSAEDQLRAIKEGKLHVTGINTGSTPLAVNAAGFVPVCGFGREKTPFTYTMKFIVPKGSSVSKVSEFSGKTLTLTNPTSNSGWKAPLVLLKRDFQLLPVRDFDVIYSNGHTESLQGIASGTYEIAAVASDETDLAIERGDVSADKFDVIFESDPFPSNIFGHTYNLQPALAEKVRNCFLTFPWPGSELESEIGSSGAGTFLPISYKDDFKLIREIDDAMGSRHEISPAKDVEGVLAESPTDD